MHHSKIGPLVSVRVITVGPAMSARSPLLPQQRKQARRLDHRRVVLAAFYCDSCIIKQVAWLRPLPRARSTYPGCTREKELVLPEVLKPMGCQSRIAHRGHDRTVTEIGLDGARIVAVVRELEAAGMAQHVGMNKKAEFAATPALATICNGQRHRKGRGLLSVVCCGPTAESVGCRSFAQALTA